MKILLTGGAGFIGSHFTKAAEARGHEVKVVDRLTYAGRRANLAGTRAELLVFGVENHERMADVLISYHPEVVVHMAAETHVCNSIAAGREVFLHTNVIGTNVLMNECLRYWDVMDRPSEFRVINVGTDEVYGSLTEADLPWTEAAPYRPNNPYAASKAASDHLARAYWHTFGLPVITTHCSNNYGTRQHPEKLIPTLVGQCAVNAPMTMHGNGQNVRDWIHVSDHCSGLLAAIEHGRPGATYNFGGNCERSNLQIAREVWRAVFGIPMPADAVTFVKDRPGNDQRYAIDSSKALRQLGWRVGPPIEERIYDVVSWYLDHPNYAQEYGPTAAAQSAARP